MAIFEYGDIPSGTLRGEVITAAAIASNGASAAYGIGTNAQRFRAPQDLIVLGAYFEAVGASQAATISNSFRRYTVYNGASGGGGTVVLGSLNLSATLASNTVRDFTMQTATSAVTVAAGEIVAVSQITVGGDHSNGTVVVAAALGINYRPL